MTSRHLASAPVAPRTLRQTELAIFRLGNWMGLRNALWLE